MKSKNKPKEHTEISLIRFNFSQRSLSIRRELNIYEQILKMTPRESFEYQQSREGTGIREEGIKDKFKGNEYQGCV